MSLKKLKMTNMRIGQKKKRGIMTYRQESYPQLPGPPMNLSTSIPDEETPIILPSRSAASIIQVGERIEGFGKTWSPDPILCFISLCGCLIFMVNIFIALIGRHLRMNQETSLRVYDYFFYLVFTQVCNYSI